MALNTKKKPKEKQNKHIYVKLDLELNYVQRLIGHKNKPSQTKACDDISFPTQNIFSFKAKEKSWKSLVVSCRSSPTCIFCNVSWCNMLALDRALN